MTIEQKRREFFEAWWSSTPSLGDNKRTIAEKAWQAALDAVVIELPADACARCDTVQEEARQESYNLGIEECRTAIRQNGLGLKVKP